MEYQPPTGDSLMTKLGSSPLANKGRKTQRGQGMTEYIIIVALIAVAAIGVYSWFGKAVREQTAAITNEVAGKSGATAITAAGTAATSGSASADQEKGLANYDKLNNQQTAAAAGGN
jgi:Flp pilus assembly pilin Flp